MKLTLLSLLALLVAFSAFAQPTQLWTWQYGDDGWERPLAMRPTPDGGVILAGDYTEVLNGQTDMIVVKLTAGGETEWVHSYGDSVKMETAFDIICMSDGGYTVVGFTGVGSSGQITDLGNSYIVRINSTGDTLWTRWYNFGGIDDIYGAVEMENGDIVVAGTSEIGPATPPDGEVFFIRFTADGDSLWTRFFHQPYTDWVQDFIRTSDGGFALTGIHNPTEDSGERQGFFAQKFDASANEQWYRIYNWEWAGFAYGIIEAEDHGFYLAGQGFDAEGTQAARVTRVNATGDTLWNRLYDLNSATGDMCLNAARAADGGILLACSNYSFTDPPLEVLDLAKVNPDGELAWQVTATPTTHLDMPTCVCQTADGGFAIGGVTFWPMDPGYQVGNMYLAKFAFPNNTPGGANQSPKQFTLAQNYPNPFNPQTEIRYSLPKAANAKVTVYDVLGREIVTLTEGPQTAGSHAVRFDGSNLAGGAYFYRLEAGSFVETRKMMLLK